MNQSELENKIQLESDKYVFDLEKHYGQQSEFKNTLTTFLKSKPHRLLLLESPDTSASAWKLLQVLKELQGVPDITDLNDYLESQNQTMLKWEKLSEILQSSEAVPKLKNLLTCEFHESVNLFPKDKARISTIMERLNLAVKGKIIFIISSKYNVFFRKVKNDSSIYFNDSENKTMPFYDISTESLIERVSIGDVSAVEKILGSGVDVNGTDLNGRTALHEAAINGRIDLALTLLRNGAKHLPDKVKDTPLHYAAKNGHEDVVKLFLENDVDVNIKGSGERAAIHYAAKSGHKNLILTLLKHGANHFPDVFMNTPLHYAANNGYEDVVKVFLENDVDVNIKGFHEQTALHYAAKSGHKNLVLTLLKHGAKHLTDKNKDEPLHLAAKNGHEDIVKLFLETDVNVNIKGYIEQTALHYAAKSGNINLVLTLLQQGANYFPDQYNNTPLHYAAMNGYEDVVKLFLENDVDVDFKDCIKRNALHYAAESGNTDSVSILLKHGAKHLSDISGDTPLHLAAIKGHEDVVKLFLENKVDVNIKGYDERTALHYAAQSGHKDLVLTLLKRGAKHFPDKDKETPLHYAAKRGYEDVVIVIKSDIKVFLENDVNVNIKGQGGWTALHYAVKRGYKDLIVTLVKKGADINLKNDEGKTALDLAKNQKKKIRLLVENLSKERTH